MKLVHCIFSQVFVQVSANILLGQSMIVNYRVESAIYVGGVLELDPVLNGTEIVTQMNVP